MVSTLDFESNNPSSILGMSFLFLFIKSIHANDVSKLF